MASTIQTFDFAMKDRFDVVTHVENLTLADRPLMAMMTKDEDFQGDGTHIPLIYGNPQGIASKGGSSLAQVQASKTQVVGKKFILTAGDYKGAVDIGDKVITASRSNPGAFLRNKAAECDGLYTQMADNLATYMYGNSGNSIGEVASVDAAGGVGGGDRIHFKEGYNAMNFEIGMLMSTSLVDGSDGGATVVDDLEIVGIERAEGWVDLAAPASGVLVDDFLFRTGDFGGDADTFIFHGLSDFLWENSTPTTIYNMVRTDDPIRLAGSRVPQADLAGLNIEERLQMLGAYMTGRYKGPGPTHGFLNPEDWQNLQISLQSKGIRPLKDDSTRFGFLHLEVAMGGRMVKLYSDRFCPRGKFFALRMKNWTLHSMLKLIHPISQDGLVLLRKGSSNDYEYRVVSYPAMSTDAPGWSGQVSLAS